MRSSPFIHGMEHFSSAGIRSGTRIGYYDSNKNKKTCAMLFVVKTEKSFIPLSHQAASDEELVLF